MSSVLTIPRTSEVDDWITQVADYAQVPWAAVRAPAGDTLNPRTVEHLVFGPPAPCPRVIVGFDASGEWTYARVENAPVGGITRGGSALRAATAAAALVTALTESGGAGSWAEWHRARTPFPPLWVSRALTGERQRLARSAVLSDEHARWIAEEVAAERAERARRAALEALAMRHPDEFAGLLVDHQVVVALEG